MWNQRRIHATGGREATRYWSMNSWHKTTHHLSAWWEQTLRHWRSRQFALRHSRRDVAFRMATWSDTTRQSARCPWPATRKYPCKSYPHIPVSLFCSRRNSSRSQLVWRDILTSLCDIQLSTWKVTMLLFHVLLRTTASILCYVHHLSTAVPARNTRKIPNQCILQCLLN